MQSALFAKLAWPSIHGPMPGTELWGQHGREDLTQLYQMLAQPEQMSGSIPLTPLSPMQEAEGWLFGGCLSVLCNLIGTPYFPQSLKGAILFFEDIGEHPGRVLRMMNQLLMTGLLAAALVLGYFGEETLYENIYRAIARRLPVPVFTSQAFGHLSPNYPLVIGARARIRNQHLLWSYGEQ